MAAGTLSPTLTPWSGVNSAVNVLAGGRGGVDLPDEDIEDVYEHLARHYEEFDEEPPELD